MDQLSPQSQERLEAMLQSRDAQQLAKMLAGSGAIRQASQAVERGDEDAAREALAPLLRDPAVAALLQRLSSQGGV